VLIAAHDHLKAAIRLNAMDEMLQQRLLHLLARKSLPGIGKLGDNSRVHLDWSHGNGFPLSERTGSCGAPSRQHQNSDQEVHRLEFETIRGWKLGLSEAEVR
jgi:hypothetical protein